MINEKCENCVLVNRKIKTPEKDFKAVFKKQQKSTIGAIVMELMKILWRYKPEEGGKYQ